jgi:prepilin peptidase CpaA
VALQIHSVPNLGQLFGAVFLCLIGFFVWYKRILGAGDVKLLAILGMSIPTREYPEVFLAITLIGLGLVLIMFIVDKLFNKYLLNEGVPYGIPICIGGWMSLIGQF